MEGRIGEGTVRTVTAISTATYTRRPTVAISATMPAITHVAVTVTDLAVSEEWYTRVLGVKPVIDEDTGPFHHIVYELGNTLLGLHGFPDLASDEPLDE